MDIRTAFVGGDAGPWRIRSSQVVLGCGIEPAGRLDVLPSALVHGQTAANFVLRGVASNVRYAKRLELTELRSREAPLGRLTAKNAALIPIKKSDAWWALSQDERRTIFEETSHHTAVGLEYLPAIARRLYHCRDLGEPFDFLTWFEYSDEHAAGFDDLTGRLRATREWTYVEREIDIRLDRI
jgi:chlorite dismutase